MGFGQMGPAKRNGNHELRALAQPACDIDRSAMQVHQFLHEREPDAGAFEGPALLSLDPMEALEKARQFMFGNADAGITHAEFDGLAVSADRDNNFAFEGELEGVGKKIENNLLPHVAIEPDWLPVTLTLHSAFET